ncbi:hypothetical protein T4E_4490 [Trichinella pseudospiralis]|uniref:PiggyBac transposable element-derived protein domain-containing protein n=1 Tax=Trichinella pseudospiralis TaxID=6337 RepID=A0A0V0Y3B0_TRIPS|nr:hypothetical protein T4E_4490 [Trichinella pseudospiralis]
MGQRKSENADNKKQITDVTKQNKQREEFFTNDMFQAIAEQSTLYATQNGNLTTKFSTCDIEQLTGIRMMMALVPMSRYWMYWLSI